MFTPTTAARGISSDSGFKPVVPDHNEVLAHWPEMEPFVRKCAQKSLGMLDVAEVHALLWQGKAQSFLLFKDGALVLVVVAQIFQYPTYSSGRVVALAGSHLKQAWEQFSDALVAWALTHNATELEGWCRPCMARLLQRLNFRPKYHVMTLDLRSKLQ